VHTAEEVGMRAGSAGVATAEARPGRRRAEHVGARAEPRRTCVVCRSTTAKRTLHRIVRSPDGTVAYDPTGKAAGRGAYLCGQPACLDQAVRRRSIQRALKVTDTAAADAAVEALRNRVSSERVALASRHHRSSDDKEVRSG
jgi:predicted RNA-binding protein YlxR (DUF448 family)